MQNSILKTSHLTRVFKRGPQEICAVNDVSFNIQRGEYVSVIGSSGSGKSTLLNLMAGLDRPTSGIIEFEGSDLGKLSRRQLSNYRAKNIGMIFQTFNLLPHRTALENVELALYFTGTPVKERKRLARETLESVGLGDRLEHKPGILSGGEQQRVAVARALVKQPDIIFADEPTGNLDKTNAQQVADFLKQLNDNGLTIILVTHDENLSLRYAHRLFKMDFGILVSSNGNKS